MILIRCADCGKPCEVPDDRAGQPERCPGCGAAIPVPAEAAAPPATMDEPSGSPSLPGLTTNDSREEAGSVPAEWTAFLAPPQSPDEIGRLGSYRILGVLGRGGMGIVFRAEDPQLGRPVALKALLPALAASPSARQRFFREAKAAAALKHPNVVTIFDVGEDRGTPFLAMELLEGQSLGARMEREGKLPVAEVLRIGREVAAGLAAAHDKGLIHRDIKPANLWLESPPHPQPLSPASGERGERSPRPLSPGGERGVPLAPLSPRGRGVGGEGEHVKILDFGLARAVGSEVNLTRHGAVLGTPAYMAPEQALGEAVDHRCDLFSLGTILYQASTGQRPFRGKDVLSILKAVARTQPPPPRDLNPDLPEGLNDLILALLSKDPAERPASAAAVVAALRSLERAATGGSPPRSARRVGEQASRRRVALVLLAAAILVVGAALVLRSRQGGEAPTRGKVAVSPPTARDEAGGKGGMEPEPFSWEPGAPLSPTALVQRPAPVRGLASWTLLPREGNDGGPPGVAYRPDGRRFAAIDVQGVVRIWEAEGGRLVQVLVGPAGPHRWVRWSPDGKSLASSHDRAVRVWDETSGRLLRTLSHPAPVSSFAWSPDGRTLAAATRKGDIHLWDLPGGEESPGFHGHTDIVWDVNWSPDGKTLASASEDGTVRLWSRESGTCLRVLSKFVRQATAVAWSPSGDEIAAAAYDRTLRVWDAAGEVVQRKTGFGVGLKALVWFPDGRTLATTDQDGVIRFWQRTSETPVLSIPASSQYILSIAASPDGKRLLSAQWTGTIQEWDVASGRELRRLPSAGLSAGPWPRLSWSPDGSKLARCSGDGEVSVWEADVGRRLFTLPSGPPVQMTAWSPDGRRLALAADRPAIHVHDAASGELLQKLEGHAASVWFAAWSPDGRTLASASDDRTVRLWDGATGKPIRTLEGHATGVRGLAWAPDGKRLATGESAGTVRLWATDAAQKPQVIDAKTAGLWTVAWSPDGKVLATGGEDKLVRLWDARSGELIREAAGHDDTVRWLSFSPDGLLASAGISGGVRVWDGGTGTFRFSPDRDGEAEQGVAWSPDGKTLAACGAQGFAYFWDPRGRLRATLLVGRPDFDLVVSAEGHFRTSAADDRWMIAALTEDGEYRLLSLEEFAAKYGWTNDPAKVQPLGRPAQRSRSEGAGRGRRGREAGPAPVEGGRENSVLSGPPGGGV